MKRKSINSYPRPEFEFVARADCGCVLSVIALIPGSEAVIAPDLGRMILAGLTVTKMRRDSEEFAALMAKGIGHHCQAAEPAPTAPAPTAPAHRYHLVLRPAEPGTYPATDTDGCPAVVVESHWPPKRLPDGHYHYATVEYPHALDLNSLWLKDLLPADPVEAAHYRFWLYADRDEKMADYLLCDYLKQDDAFLEVESAINGLAEAALTIRRAEQALEAHGIDTRRFP